MLTMLLLAALQAVGGPSVEIVEPDTLIPYRPAELTIRGSGFGDECRVLLGPPGRLVPVRHRLVGADEIRVLLSAGYGPSPAERQLVVDCGGRRRTAPVTLRIVAPAEPEPEEPPPASEGPDVQPMLAAAPPLVTRLDPAAAPAGSPFTLTVLGARFEPGARVEVYANANAGSSEPPTYRMLDFAAEVASDTVLLVDFDRGFAPSPRLRQVVVVNPDGGASAPLCLEITRRSP